MSTPRGTPGGRTMASAAGRGSWRGGSRPQGKSSEQTRAATQQGRGRAQVRGSSGTSRGASARGHANPKRQQPQAAPAPGRDPDKAGSRAQYMKTMADTWQQLRESREAERRAAIRSGLMADPDKKTSLAEAITPVGACTDMCPEHERVERIVQQMVDRCERRDAADGGEAVPWEPAMVKRFRRSAAGTDDQIPSDIRPPEVLRRTLDYLLDAVVGGPKGLATVHKFVWDRTRAIRNDFSIQQVTRAEDLAVAIECFERIARFHLVSLHQLSRPGAGAVEFDAHQEREQLANTLLSLTYYYDDSRGKLDAAHEPEFRAYCIIFEIQDRRPDLLDRVQAWPPAVLRHPRVQAALHLYKAAASTADDQGPLQPRVPFALALANPGRFWAVMRSPRISYLAACAAEVYFNQVRGTALAAIYRAYRRPTAARMDDLTTDMLTGALGFDTEEQAQAFCEEHGFSVKERDDGEAYIDLNSLGGRATPADSNPGRGQTFSRTYVEAKRHRRTLPAVIRGYTVARATEEGHVEDSDETAQHESLFVSDDDEAPKPAPSAAANPFQAAAAASSPFTAMPQANPFATAARANPFAAGAQASPFAAGSQANPFAARSQANPSPQLSNQQIATSVFGSKSSSVAFTPGMFSAKAEQPAATSPFAPKEPKAESPFATQGTTSTFGSFAAKDSKAENPFAPKNSSAENPFATQSTPPAFSTFATKDSEAPSPFAMQSTGPGFNPFAATASTPPEAPAVPNAAPAAAAPAAKPSTGLFNLPAAGPSSGQTEAPSLFAKPVTPSLFPASQPTTSPFSSPTPQPSTNNALPAPSEAQSSGTGAPVPAFSTMQSTQTQQQPLSAPMFQSFGAPSTSTQEQPRSEAPAVPPVQHFPSSINAMPARHQPPPPSFMPPSNFTQPKPPAPSKTSGEEKSQALDKLARKMFLGQGGILEMFVETLLPPIVAKAQRKVERERNRATAAQARTLLLSLKYSRKWKEIAHRRVLARKGRERRRAMAQTLRQSLNSTPRSSMSPIDRPRDNFFASDLSSSLAAVAEDRKTKSGSSVTTRPQAWGSIPQFHVSGGSRNSTAMLPPPSPSQNPRSSSVFKKPDTPLRHHRRSQTADSAASASSSVQSGRISKYGSAAAASSFRDRSLQSRALGDVKLLQRARRLVSGRTDTTQTDYFRLKALGVDPDTPWLPQTRKRPHSVISSEDGDDDRFSLASTSRPPSRAGPPSASMLSPRMRSMTETSLVPTREGYTPTPARPSDEDEDLFARVRRVRLGMAESEAWVRSARESREREMSTAGSTQGDRVVSGGRISGASTPSRTAMRLQETGAKGLWDRWQQMVGEREANSRAGSEAKEPARGETEELEDDDGEDDGEEAEGEADDMDYEDDEEEDEDGDGDAQPAFHAGKLRGGRGARESGAGGAMNGFGQSGASVEDAIEL